MQVMSRVICMGLALCSGFCVMAESDESAPWAIRDCARIEAELAAAEAEHGARAIELLKPLTALAQAYETAQNFEKAVSTYERSIAIYMERTRRVKGDWQAPVRARISMLNALAGAKLRVGNSESREAAKVYRQALVAAQILRMSEKNEDVCRARAGLALSQIRDLSVADRVGVYPQLMSATESSFGKKSLETASVIDEWIVHHAVTTTLGDAEALAKRLLAIRRVRLPSGHPDIADALCRLASVYDAQKDRENDITPLLKEAYQIRLNALGASHPATLRLRVIED